MYGFNTIPEAIEDIKNGKMIIVVDDEDRENEGDLVMAADKVTPEAINFMAKYARGLICTPLSSERAKELQLEPMVKDNDSIHHTAFTVSVDAVEAGTGISARDRSKTIEVLCNPSSLPKELLRPGHIFPLIARDGGVLERPGHTEATIDLCKMAGVPPIGVICEVMNDDGTMARRDELFEFGKEHGLKVITIKDLIEYRKKKPSGLTHQSAIDFSNRYGNFTLHMFENESKNEHHVAMTKGTFQENESVLVRVHSECFTGDIFGSKRCDCGDQLDSAMKLIESEQSGILIYLRQEGRGIGLPNKIKAYSLQDQGFDTVEANHQLGFEADARTYDVAAQILNDLGVKRVRLMTNNPLKITGLEEHNIEVTERVSIEISANETNHNYLKTKKDKMGHMLETLTEEK
jgi:3,4-dihydroxy 2-butanone 4-phosphate synthase/GTP cyclohydrolase II